MKKSKGKQVLISIFENNGMYIQNKYKVSSKKGFGSSYADEFIEKGDKALNENRFSDAINYYNRAKNINPMEMKVYKQMAKAQFGLKDFLSAEQNFKIYLEKNPKDVDTIIELGESQRQRGDFKAALETFKQAFALDNKNDLAARSIQMTENNMLAVFSPGRAKRERAAYAKQNLKAALDMTVKFMTPEYMDNLKNIRVQFGPTASMGGTGNIAQYEYYKNSITVSNSYIYAKPQVIAAYIAHESVHAHDNDPFTSVREEQDAYEIATQFWIKNSRGVKDPEMDYAAELYKQSPEILKDRVAEIYTLRDPSISETSPYHPPHKFLNLNITAQGGSASQPLKAYDVIA